MYVQLLLTVDPQSDTRKTQQTPTCNGYIGKYISQKKVTKVQVLPNPAAQFPSALPPLLVHSELE